MRWKTFFFVLIAVMSALAIIQGSQEARKVLQIADIKPTIFFPKVQPGEPLRQLAQLRLTNPGRPATARVKIAMRGQEAYSDSLGEIPAGKSERTIRIPDIARPTELTVEVYVGDMNAPAAWRTLVWQPQRKWKIYHVAYSHHDLGYADYYHMMRRDVREWGTELALIYCRQTDDWDDDSKYRWTIETAEPLTAFIGSHTKAEVDELARRIREGRIELGAIHNSVNSEAMSYEALARLFYTPNRYVVDLLGIEPRRTALLDDVVGLTRPLPLYSKEAGLPYFYHGRNGLQDQLQPASSHPLYAWLAPDGDRDNMTLFRTQPYHLATGEFSAGIQALTGNNVQKLINTYAQRKDWAYDSILSVDCWDFSLPELHKANEIRNWNAGWSYPRIISATMTMFFDDLSRQMDRAKTFVFDKDAPNSWIDEDYTDVEASAGARVLGYELPTLEKISTLAMAVGGAGYPWRDIWQAYNRLLMYHEHTNAAYAEGPIYAPPSLKDKTAANALYYETEVEMHRRLITEGQEFAARARDRSLPMLEKAITTTSDGTLVVFNPLNWERTDVVRLEAGALPVSSHLIDNVTGEPVPSQRLSNGTVAFVAERIPSLGYKTYQIAAGEPEAGSGNGLKATDDTLENQYYKVAFDPKTGGILSIRDKQLDTELVDQQAPYRLNEYLYNHIHGNTPKWYRPEKADLSPEAGPVAAIMTATIKAFGTNQLRQEVILYRDLKRIDFTQHIDKASCGRTLEDYKGRDPERADNHKEAVFYALPFRVPGFRIHHELSGAVVEPIADQSQGSSTDYYGIQHFSDMSNQQFGVTLATIEGGLIEYGKPRHSQVWVGESDLKRPTESHMYMYLMNNWFGTNIRIDQPGPKMFRWSIQSHTGGWKEGKADSFGWNVSHPLIARVMEGQHQGALPPGQYSFLEVDKPNVVLTTLKAAEANGSGLILRFNELSGEETRATVSVPFMGKISKANETSLIEADRPGTLEVTEGNHIHFAMRPHGVKTIRIQSAAKPPQVQSLNGRALSDMEVEISWPSSAEAESISHYNIYRDTSPGFQPGLRYQVGRSEGNSFVDRPRLDYGGWLSNRLELRTTYYYKVSAVDRWNNEGPASAEMQVTTLRPSEKNAVPVRVEGLYAVNVSPVSPHNYVSLWFYTNPESDVTHYRVYRGTAPGFIPDGSNLLTEIDATATFTHTTPHGFGTVTRELREYNRILYVDETVAPGTTYYYKACAVDSAGQAGPYSREARVGTKALARPASAR